MVLIDIMDMNLNIINIEAKYDKNSIANNYII